MTASLALADLRTYALQLASLFPPSADRYPSDSLVRVQQARAAAWVDRLLQLQRNNDAGVNGWQLVPFAEVAFRAGDDSLARSLFDRRAQSLPARSAERAYVLHEAVNTFADQTQETARLSASIAMAERYAALMSAVPASGFPKGYRTENDSTAILYHHLRTEDTLLTAYDILSDSAGVLTHGYRVYAIVPRVSPDEREGMIEFAYQLMVPAMGPVAGTAVPRARVESLNAQSLAAASRIPGGWRTDATPQERARRLTELVARVKDNIALITASFALAGKPSVGIPAHAWFNTQDSVYRQNPVTHTFADGMVRVLVWSDLHDSEHLSMVNRVQRWFPRRVEGVVITASVGHTGPDIATPAEEVEWLRAYYEGKRHFTVPIAVWAGPKMPSPAMTASGVGSTPRPSPTDSTLYEKRGAPIVIVDGRGVIRATLDVRTRAQEVTLRRRLAAILAESETLRATQIPAQGAS